MGPTRTPDRQSRIRVTITLEPEVLKALREESIDEERSLSNHANRVVRNHLREVGLLDDPHPRDDDVDEPEDAESPEPEEADEPDVDEPDEEPKRDKAAA